MEAETSQKILDFRQFDDEALNILSIQQFNEPRIQHVIHFHILVAHTIHYSELVHACVEHLWKSRLMNGQNLIQRINGSAASEDMICSDTSPMTICAVSSSRKTLT